jgi:hypothetical protein
LPVQVLSITQVPFSGGAIYQPDNFFVLGNAGGESAALAFNIDSGAYGPSAAISTGGPFANPPVDQGAGHGFSGFIAFGNDEFGQDFEEPTSGGATGPSTSGSNPCSISLSSPIGYDDSGTLYCQVVLGSIYDSTHAVYVASGQLRLVRVINGVDYFVTNNDGTSVGRTVYAAGSTVSGALCVGASETSSSTGYFGNSDGTVNVIGGGTAATFSSAVESVVGYNSTIYAYESDGVFGVSGPSGTFESQPLPIGAVVDVVTGVNGAPMLVETDGTLDVIGI